jgi:hypothetical protein
MIVSPRPTDVNYDEARVPAYRLPDPLVCTDGRRVTSAELWRGERRSELLALFTREIYGAAPASGWQFRAERASVDERALGGLATRSEWRGVLLGAGTGHELAFDVLIWVPNRARAKAPVFVGLNFFGNHSVHPDPGISLARGWVPNNEEYGLTQHVANEGARGCQSDRWPVELLVARGYALATCYAGDFDPDYDDGFGNGVHALFAGAPRSERTPSEWGTIGAWAWGMSRVLDLLEHEQRIDMSRAIAIGHSRFGKTALWAAAQDSRFALAISNNSGHGGAALSRRCFGERIRHLNQRFPHWFCHRFRAYDDREAELPVDQHELLALIAPRPVYVASARQDLWADPVGEFLACKHADPVYRLLGRDGFPADLEAPPVAASTGGSIGYHLREGVHNVTKLDWWHYLAFADRHLLPPAE